MSIIYHASLSKVIKKIILTKKTILFDIVFPSMNPFLHIMLSFEDSVLGVGEEVRRMILNSCEYSLLVSWYC